MVTYARHDVTKEEIQDIVREHYRKEPVICKEFGCGKVMTDEQRLFGDRCPDHQKKERVDIMKVLKFE